MHILIANILKLSTGIDKIAYRYWQNCLPVLAKSPSSTSIDEIVYQGNKLAFSQYWYIISLNYA